MGIGKSSLLARARLEMEGFQSEHRANSLVIVGNKTIETLDDAARCVLQELISIDERHNKIKFAFGSFFEFENTEIVQNFRDRHHLAVVMRALRADYLRRALDADRMLIIAIDEAEKCPVPIAQFIRALVTHSQQQGIQGLRFVVTGVSPFFESMLNEDRGISRFFYKVMSLEPLQEGEAHELVCGKLIEVARDARSRGYRVTVEPSVVDRVVALSGGHPHSLQLLGSHLIEHEEDNPDGSIDSRDLHDSLVRICYEDRAAVYGSILHELELYNRLDSLHVLLGLSSDSPKEIVSRGFPTRIDKELAHATVDATQLSWFVSNNVLRLTNPDHYGLVDEFLRVRMLLDKEEDEHQRELTEQRLLDGRIRMDWN
jgi:hypothetical protein